MVFSRLSTAAENGVVKCTAAAKRPDIELLGFAAVQCDLARFRKPYSKREQRE